MKKLLSRLFWINRKMMNKGLPGRGHRHSAGLTKMKIRCIIQTNRPFIAPWHCPGKEEIMANRNELHPGVSVTYQGVLYKVVGHGLNAVKLCHVSDHGHPVIVNEDQFGEICLLDSPEGVEARMQNATVRIKDPAPALGSPASTPPASA